MYIVFIAQLVRQVW